MCVHYGSGRYPASHPISSTSTVHKISRREGASETYAACLHLAILYTVILGARVYTPKEQHEKKQTETTQSLVNGS